MLKIIRQLLKIILHRQFGDQVYRSTSIETFMMIFTKAFSKKLCVDENITLNYSKIMFKCY